jgi:F-type H+-transporting ATPase subunit epsilon
VPVPLRVVSVEESLFEGEVDMVICHGADGELGILPRHAPLLTSLQPGALVIRSPAGDRELFVGGGFLEVLPDRITVLADVAERAEDISEESAEQARHHALERLQGHLTAEEKIDLEQELRMAEARLHLVRTLRRRS